MIALIVHVHHEPRSETSTSIHSRHECSSPAWWFLRGAPTRSHSEHGRENPQRRWYFVSRRGRVGRCQACQAHPTSFSSDPRLPPDALDRRSLAHGGAAVVLVPAVHAFIAGWSSPVARQAHNLKVVSSNLAPATKEKRLRKIPIGTCQGENRGIYERLHWRTVRGQRKLIR